MNKTFMSIIFILIFTGCNNSSETYTVREDTVYTQPQPQTLDTTAINPQENLTVRGVGIMNSGGSDVTFYLSSTGQPPFSEETLSPGEAHDYQIDGMTTYILISTEGGGADKYTLYKNSRYHLILDDKGEKWIVVSDR